MQFVEVDKQVLVEKIVRLQRSLARKGEKVEFLEEHVNQLINELQRKAKYVGCERRLDFGMERVEKE